MRAECECEHIIPRPSISNKLSVIRSMKLERDFLWRKKKNFECLHIDFFPVVIARFPKWIHFVSFFSFLVFPHSTFATSILCNVIYANHSEISVLAPVRQTIKSDYFSTWKRFSSAFSMIKISSNDIGLNKIDLVDFIDFENGSLDIFKFLHRFKLVRSKLLIAYWFQANSVWKFSFCLTWEAHCSLGTLK